MTYCFVNFGLCEKEFALNLEVKNSQVGFVIALQVRQCRRGERERRFGGLCPTFPQVKTRLQEGKECAVVVDLLRIGLAHEDTSIRNGPPASLEVTLIHEDTRIEDERCRLPLRILGRTSYVKDR